MKERIEKKLSEAFKSELLQVKNNSYLHSGHSGDNGSGETHFAITIKSEELKNLSQIQAHRKINELLKSEFENGMHALEIKVLKGGV